MKKIATKVVFGETLGETLGETVRFNWSSIATEFG